MLSRSLAGPGYRIGIPAMSYAFKEQDSPRSYNVAHLPVRLRLFKPMLPRGSNLARYRFHTDGH